MDHTLQNLKNTLLCLLKMSLHLHFHPHFEPHSPLGSGEDSEESGVNGVVMCLCIMV